VTLHIKHSDGTWHIPASGDLWFRPYLGWISVQKVWVKTDTGVWKDSGYIGLPGVPTNVSIVSSNYSTMRVSWEAPTTLIQPIRYNVELYNADTERVVSNTETKAEVRVATWGVNMNTRYRVRVRCIGPNGAYSGWSVPLRWRIGQPGTPNRAW
jgi:Fibronectin type III domain